MDLRPVFFVFLVLQFHLKLVSTEGFAEGPPLDSKGREFIFAIPGSSNSIPVIEVTSESHGVTEISVDQPAFERSYQQTISYGEVASFRLTSEAVARGAGFFDGAVVVYASKDVSVTCVVDTVAGTYADGFLAIPVDALDKEYYVVTYDTGETLNEFGHHQEHLSKFIITATQDNTRVSVELRTAATFNTLYQAGETIEFELRWKESAQIESSSDLTGSKVTASRAVALVAGNDCSDTLLVFRYCSYLVEQLPPVSTWGRSFVLANMDGRPGLVNTVDVWRILAPFPNTTLTFTDNHVTRVTVYDPIWYDYKLKTSKIVMLTADRAVMVVQYIAGGKSSASVLTVPTEQFTDSATAATTTTAGSEVKEYILVYRCAEESSLLVNEEPLRNLKDSERLREETYCAVTLGNEFQQDRE
ncbi:IgGFc-binding protein-like [Asterias amurensis]|uniref:IgGFc-binding protein-like n=1 Tax=Asterias amurensis TaxID=7602 RepID=UPI003AB5A8BF